MTKTQEQLLKVLVAENAIGEDKVAEIKKFAEDEDKKIDEILVNKKYVDEDKLAQTKAKIFDLPFISLAEMELKQAVVNTIPKEVAENYRIICFERTGSRIKVGLVDPENFKALEAVDFLAKGSNLTVEHYLITPKDFKIAFKAYQSFNQELSSALKSRAEEEEGKVELDEKDEIKLEEMTKSAPVAKIVSVIIRNAVEGGASDIHVEPLMKESRVRYRIDGILHTSLVLPKNVHNSVVARIKVMANLKLDETRIPQDGRIRLEIGEKTIDFRVSTLPLIGAEKVVMRILDTTRGAPKLQDLGFEGEQLKAILDATKNTEGIILVTGPTGSGKSTTLFSVLDLVNKEGVNIATLEDPVEYQMKGVNQSQVKPEIGYTFASGLRSFLRQDPDIIMVGEIRDEETAELAIHAALTGHLVFSTLHTTDSPGAITRLIDMNIQAFLLGSTLVAVVAQRLARKICKNCKEEVKMPAEVVEEIKADIEKIGLDYVKKLIPGFKENELHFYKGKGCHHCGNTGYAGRMVVTEVLSINEKLKEMVLGGKRSLSLKEIKDSQHFITVKQDGVLKVLQGLTAMEEVWRVMKD